MSKPKHTPGPWKFLTEVSHDRLYLIPNPVLGPKGEVVCSLVTHENEETEQANARLILAAPELLGALKKTLKALQCEGQSECGDICGETYTCYSCQILPAVKAAIAKAEGETK